MSVKKPAVVVEDAPQIVELEMVAAPLWTGGNGMIQHITIARDEGEALNNLCEINPVLLAIGVSAEPMRLAEGYEVVALVPEDYVFGNDRRIVEEEQRRIVEEQRLLDEQRLAEEAETDILE